MKVRLQELLSVCCTLLICQVVGDGVGHAGCMQVQVDGQVGGVWWWRQLGRVGRRRKQLGGRVFLRFFRRTPFLFR